MLTEQEKVVLANREKDKGNEAFKSGDYEEAVAYYARSVKYYHQHYPYTSQHMLFGGWFNTVLSVIL